MKIKVKKKELIEGLQTVQSVISPKSTLPILSNILIQTQKNKLRLLGTDLDIGIICEIPVDIQEEGGITLPAKRFSDIIKDFPQEEIEIITKKNNTANIITKSIEFKIMGNPVDEFPKLPEISTQNQFSLPQDVLKEMIRLTSFAVSLDETRYILSGILFVLTRNKITLVATDGKRLALVERKLESMANIDEEIKIIVPIKTIHELERNLKEEKDIVITLGGNQVLFSLDNLEIISRLIEGEFPDYRQVIPPLSENKISLEREALLDAIRRAALLVTPDYQAVRLELFKNKLVVSKSTPDVGESREELPAEYKGKELIIGFNPSYLIDVLKNLNQTRIDIEIIESEKPAVIRLPDYLYIVLPMRLG